MNGIDIASYQRGINLDIVPGDFVIVKSTQGKSYRNPDFQRAAEQAMNAGKLVGAYHYVNGCGAQEEARHFVDTVKPYIGKILLCVDWEGESNKQWGNTNYVLELLREVEKLTGIIPAIYCSASVCRTFPESATRYPLWVAQYPIKTSVGFRDLSPSAPIFPWKHPAIFQYTSGGQLPGWSGKLDLDRAFLTRTEWERLCKPVGSTAPATPATPTTAPSVSSGELMHEPARVGIKFSVVARSGLNMRADAGTSAQKICVIPCGAEVIWKGKHKILPGGELWLKVTWRGAEGFVMRKFLSD